MVEALLAFGFKLVIVDEAHSFKNTESLRSKALIQFLHDISETEITKTLDFQCVMCHRKWTEDVKIKVNLKYTTKNPCFNIGHSALYVLLNTLWMYRSLMKRQEALAVSSC